MWNAWQISAVIAPFQEEGIQESCSISLRSYLPPSVCQNFQGKEVQQSHVELEVKLALILLYCRMELCYFYL